MVTFAGKNDTTMGWAEKIPFYRAAQIHRQGGFHFFDPRDHAAGNRAWMPMWATSWLYRMRTDLSFPAFSNCSADGDPGDGTAASGDSIGTFNGPLDWAPAVTDSLLEWGDTLYRYEVIRSSDGALIQSGVLLADSIGLITVPGVKVHRSGSRLTIKAPNPLAEVTALGSGDGRLRIVPPRSPLSGAAPVTVVWPHAGEARLDLLDASGRRVRSLLHGPVPDGPAVFQLDSSGLPSSVYFLQAAQGSARAVSRVVILR